MPPAGHARNLSRLVREAMSSPVLTCRSTDPVRAAAAMMARARVGALVVTDEDRMPRGVVTERDLVEKILAKGRNGDITVLEVMTPNLITIGPDQSLQLAALAMVRVGIRHLPVVEDGRLVGMLSLRDLARDSLVDTLLVLDAVESAGSIEDLAQASRSVDEIARSLVREGVAPVRVRELITELTDRLCGRILSIVERQMLDEGLGPPPTLYCWLALGSGGRREQVFPGDQDNAIIYDDRPKPEGALIQRYFLRLGQKAVEGLIRCGFPPCPGGVMARNPRWCRSFQEWQEVLREWMSAPTAENVRASTIFLDFRPVGGDFSLADDLRDYVTTGVGRYPVFLQFLARDALEHPLPLGIFGRLVPESSGPHRGEIDLKRSGSVQLVDAARVWALQRGIPETSTLGRLGELQRHGVISSDECDFVEAAFETLFTFRLRINGEKKGSGRDPDNYVSLAGLSRLERHRLREALRQAGRVQSLLGASFLLRM